MRLRSTLLFAVALSVLPSCGGGTTSPETDSGVPLDAPITDARPSEDAARDATSDAPVDADGDGTPSPLDCDDSDPTVHPGADELCNDADDDCDGATDEEPTDPTTYWRDADGDGYGAVADAQEACDVPVGYVANDDDCDDTDRDTSPDASEICNVFDDDCDGVVDDGATDARTWYRDVDADGFGTAAETIATCDLVAPAGHSDVATDCDDTNAAVSPTASELCSTPGVDDDCDGMADEADASDAATWYRDADLDGYGTAATTREACANPTTPVEAWAATAGDCDDSVATTNPGATDVADDATVDADCDGVDGTASRTIFVASSASGCGCVTSGTPGAGSRNTPFCTLPQGIAAATPPTHDTIAIANGTYSEGTTIQLRSGVHLVGGFVCTGMIAGVRQWTRSLPSATTIVASAGGAGGVTMSGTGEGTGPTRIGVPTRLDGLQITGPDMAAAAGVESIALRLTGLADASLVVLRNVRLRGGQGGHGTNGAGGGPITCSIPGGWGGNRSSGDCGADGGGAGSAGGAGSWAGGGGGPGASYCSGACGPVNYDGVSDGTNGSPGGSGNNGGGGAAGASPRGTFAASGDWIPSDGTGGGSGAHGGGGGGGGQGGSRGQCACIGCCWNRWGGAGGGGGRGGCAGGAGTAGTSGGASIALELVRATLSIQTAVVIVQGAGGRGGNGGTGAHGETGPGGAPGGGRYFWECSAGAYYGAAGGGSGGSGGSGGGGGGGAAGHGGPSWGIVRLGVGAGYVGTPSFVSGGTGGAPGAPGAGGHQGVTGPAAASGAAGVGGETQPTVVLP